MDLFNSEIEVNEHELIGYILMRLADYDKEATYKLVRMIRELEREFADNLGS